MNSQVCSIRRSVSMPERIISELLVPVDASPFELAARASRQPMCDELDSVPLKTSRALPFAGICVCACVCVPRWLARARVCVPLGALKLCAHRIENVSALARYSVLRARPLRPFVDANK